MPDNTQDVDALVELVRSGLWQSDTGCVGCHSAQTCGQQEGEPLDCHSALTTLADIARSRLLNQASTVTQEGYDWRKDLDTMLRSRTADLEGRIVLRRRLAAHIEALTARVEEAEPLDVEVDGFYCLADGHQHRNRYAEALCSARFQIAAVNARADEAEATCAALTLRNEELQRMVDAGLERSSEAAREAVKR